MELIDVPDMAGVLGYMKKLRKTIRQTSKLVRSMTTRRDGFKRPLLAGLAIGDYTYIEELWMSQLLGQLSATGVFVDVGANIGQTLLALKSVHPESWYVGFEPNSACAFYINQLIRKNAFKNTHIVPVGLSDENRVAPLWISKGYTAGAGSTLAKNVKSLKKKAPHFVPAFALDEVWEDLHVGAPSFIKIDVEGHEPEVLKGAVNSIRTHKPFLSIEFIPPVEGDEASRQEYNSARREIRATLQQIVKDIDYRIFRVMTAEDSTLVGLKHVDEFSVAPRGKAAKYSYKSIEKYKHDYLLAPLSRLPELRALIRE